MVDDPNKKAENPFSPSSKVPSEIDGEDSTMNRFESFISNIDDSQKKIIASIAIILILMLGGGLYFYFGDWLCSN